MLVCVNGSWKIPVAYYFVKGLSGEALAEETKKVLKEVSSTGVTITSITFDGLQTNFAMCAKLGAKISADNLTDARFVNPLFEKPIYVLPDGCHVLKLIRNAFANQDIYDADGNVISWKFVEKLVDLQEIQGLNLGTKITRQHINFDQNKMNVRLAAQTLSESCSVALRYVRDHLQIPEFQEVKSFDILNSRERYNKNKCKTGIDRSNVDEIRKKVNNIIEYIKGLRTINGTPVIAYARKTGFLGMIISLHNVVQIYETFIKPSNGYLLTYKLSQDHLENFFSAVRSKGGYSNNPTCYQFTNIFKKLLVHADVKESKYANCISLDNTNLLQISSKKQINSTDSLPNHTLLFETDNVLSECDDFYGKGKNKKYIDDTVAHIAGFVVTTI